MSHKQIVSFFFKRKPDTNCHECHAESCAKKTECGATEIWWSTSPETIKIFGRISQMKQQHFFRFWRGENFRERQNNLLLGWLAAYRTTFQLLWKRGITNILQPERHFFHNSDLLHDEISEARGKIDWKSPPGQIRLDDRWMVRNDGWMVQHNMLGFMFFSKQSRSDKVLFSGFCASGWQNFIHRRQLFGVVGICLECLQ